MAKWPSSYWINETGVNVCDVTGNFCADLIMIHACDFINHLATSHHGGRCSVCRGSQPTLATMWFDCVFIGTFIWRRHFHVFIGSNQGSSEVGVQKICFCPKNLANMNFLDKMEWIGCKVFCHFLSSHQLRTCKQPNPWYFLGRLSPQTFPLLLQSHGHHKHGCPSALPTAPTTHHNTPACDSPNRSRFNEAPHRDEWHGLDVLAFKRLDGTHDCSLEITVNWWN